MNEKNGKKILVFGAGVLGSLYASRLAQIGYDVTVVARGQRFLDIQTHGIVLEDFETKEQTTIPVNVVDRMPEDDAYAFCLVCIQKTQLESALPDLSRNRVLRSFVFMVNNAKGPQTMIDALGKERVLMGFGNVGGERDGHIVRYMAADKKPITLGEVDGTVSDRLRTIGSVFEAAGFKVAVSRNMDAWLRHHVALVGPLANALYMAGGSNFAVARSRTITKKGILGMKEAIKVVRANGFPIEPPSLRILLLLPTFILVPLARRVFALPILDIGGTRHALAARREMTALNEELFEMAKKVGMKTPAMEELHRYSDPSVEPAIPKADRR